MEILGIQMGEIPIQHCGFSAQLLVHSQGVITATACSCVTRSAYYYIQTVTFALHCFRHNQNLQIFFYCIVAKTLNLVSTLLKKFEVQYC